MVHNLGFKRMHAVKMHWVVSLSSILVHIPKCCTQLVLPDICKERKSSEPMWWVMMARRGYKQSPIAEQPRLC